MAQAQTLTELCALSLLVIASANHAETLASLQVGKQWARVVVHGNDNVPEILKAISTGINMLNGVYPAWKHNTRHLWDWGARIELEGTHTDAAKTAVAEHWCVLMTFGRTAVMATVAATAPEAAPEAALEAAPEAAPATAPAPSAAALTALITEVYASVLANISLNQGHPDFSSNKPKVRKAVSNYIVSVSGQLDLSEAVVEAVRWKLRSGL